MRIKPSAPAVVELFQRLLADVSGESRIMFGCPSGFLGGNLFTGVFQSRLFVRLAEPDRAKLLAQEGAQAFDPMGGRPMKEYVVVPDAWLEGDADDVLGNWIAKAATYARTLPPKGLRRASSKKTGMRRAGSK
jgi:TfoX/Sxy family transcriptional regulator of competence genes